MKRGLSFSPLATCRYWLTRPWATFLGLLAILVGPGCGKRMPAEIFTLPPEFRGYLGSPGYYSICMRSDSLADSSRICFQYESRLESVQNNNARCEDGHRASENSEAQLYVKFPFRDASVNMESDFQIAFQARERLDRSDSVLPGQRPVFRLGNFSWQSGMEWLLENGNVTPFRPLVMGSDGLAFEVLAPAPGLLLEQLLVARSFKNPNDEGQPLASWQMGVQEMRLSRKYGLVYLDLIYLDNKNRRRNVILTRQL